MNRWAKRPFQPLDGTIELGLAQVVAMYIGHAQPANGVAVKIEFQ